MRVDESSLNQVNPMVAMLMAMDERHDAREAQYRREREIYQRQRDDRESANQQMMMLLVARLVGGGAGAISEQNNEEDRDKQTGKSAE
ncbi:hypothetical protein JG687_00012829 [Phytophthora cactorum]|uniref:Uncharacterized protein n=1 Tax=Phytophthora cactorum TaxID=29920 RepID=A0A329RNE3_9STRA|nr:hypothetical protein Pcac1_g15780 [Phytophthora cactorum]KAG2803988.1 hypothetical protein PC112_g18929 [Phytophthora cactorum]KAG2834700.1 hypothetical protein PC111_g5714 [Phytophthora cactorum]KAG2861588.1 hypothetical protein PC113_g7036 [Phytophthora cactorum]KAG2894108.1 hypothetical protein PC115_g18258 [Phytophthora cactorum]